MATRKIKTIAVDERFFKNIFEEHRKSLQTEMGIKNLSQTNFTKMITGFKFSFDGNKGVRKTLNSGNRRRPRNDFFKI